MGSVKVTIWVELNNGRGTVIEGEGNFDSLVDLEQVFAKVAHASGNSLEAAIPDLERLDKLPPTPEVEASLTRRAAP